MSLRVVEIDGEPWFVAKDVCDALGMRTDNGIAQWTGALDQDEMNTHRISIGKRGNPIVVVVSESGLYALILRSRKPAARAFRKWVTSEVLPSIRKHGMYMTQEVAREAVEDPMTLMARAVVVANEQLGIMTVRAHGLDPTRPGPSNRHNAAVYLIETRCPESGQHPRQRPCGDCAVAFSTCSVWVYL